MKKKITKLFVAVAMFTVVGLSSCTKECYSCTYAGYTDTYCKPDGYTNGEWKDEIKAFETSGAKCN